MKRGLDAASAARGVSYLWLQNGVSLIARVVAFAFFARLISVEQMGVFTILTLASSAASTFMGLGFTGIVIKFIAEDIAKGKREEAASAYYKGLLLSEAASVLIAAGFLVSRFPAGVSHLPNSPEVSFITLLFAIDVVATIGPIAVAAFYGLLEFKAYAVIYGVYAALRPWLVVLLIYEVKSLVGLVEAWVIADSVFAVYVFAYLWRRLGPPVFKFDTKYLLKLSLPLYFANVATFLYGTFDQLTLIPLVSLSALGVYGAAITGYSAYNGVIAAVNSVLLPVFSSVHGIDASEGLKSAAERASRYVSIVAIPLAFALVATARPVLTLLVGRGYEAGALPLAILALASTATIISLSLRPILIVLNETRLAALTSILPIPISVAVALISIPTLGIVGASIARGLSLLLGLLLTWYFVRRKISVKLDYETIIKSLLASGFMAVSIEALQLLYYNPYSLPVYLLVGAVVFILATRALRVLSAADMDLLHRILGSRFGGRVSNLLSRLLVR